MAMTYEALLKGHQSFITSSLPERAQQYHTLGTQGQSPRVLMITCCDSRIDPCELTGASVGDLFIVRNVANFIPSAETTDGIAYDSTMAAIQYAVLHLEVSDLVVLGHTQCGGIAAVMDTDDSTPATNEIQQWIQLIIPAKKRWHSESSSVSDMSPHDQCAQHAIQYSLNNCMTHDWLRSRVESNQLNLHGWYVDLATGQIQVLEHQS